MTAATSAWILGTQWSYYLNNETSLIQIDNTHSASYFASSSLTSGVSATSALTSALGVSTLTSASGVGAFTSTTGTGALTSTFGAKSYFAYVVSVSTYFSSPGPSTSEVILVSSITDSSSSFFCIAKSDD
jgi:hypothetical protein